MSNRAERRAAERAANKSANKAAKAQSITQTLPAEQPLAAAMPASFPFDIDFTNEPNHETSETTGDRANDTKASEAQINANRENAQKSTGAKTAEGKATISQNRRTHGLIGNFCLLESENRADFLTLKEDVIREYQPGTSSTEWRLVQTLIQHYWLMLRAVRLQDESLNDPKMLALYMRYQTTHERSYYRAQKELQKLVKERAKEQIGFERQNAEHEAHQARTRLQNAKAESIEIDSTCKKAMLVPIPGFENVPFKDIAEACSLAITEVVYARQGQNNAA